MPKEDLGVSENLEQQSLTYTLSTSLGPWLVPCPPGRSLRGCWAEGLKVVRLFAPNLRGWLFGQPVLVPGKASAQ